MGAPCRRPRDESVPDDRASGARAHLSPRLCPAGSCASSCASLPSQRAAADIAGSFEHFDLTSRLSLNGFSSLVPAAAAAHAAPDSPRDHSHAPEPLRRATPDEHSGHGPQVSASIRRQRQDHDGASWLGIPGWIPGLGYLSSLEGDLKSRTPSFGDAEEKGEPGCAASETVPRVPETPRW